MGFVTAIWELFFYYTVLFGCGVAAIYGPMMATVSRWFTEKRGLAIGLTAAGIGAGSLVMSPLVALIISSYGWRIAYIVIGTMTWVIFIPITIFIKRPSRKNLGVRSQEESAQGFSFAEALKTKALWILSLSWFFMSGALWAIMVHIVPLLTDKGITLKTAGLIAGLIGGGSILGRVIAGMLSDKLGRKFIILTAYYFQLMMLIWLLFSKEAWMFLVFTPLFGVSSGGWGSAMATVPADYFGLKATGIIFGFILIIAGIGVAICPYIGGYIFDMTHSYHYMITMCIFATIAAIILFSFFKAPAKV